MEKSTDESVKLINQEIKKVPLEKLKPVFVKKEGELDFMIKHNVH